MPNGKTLAWMAAVAIAVTVAHDRYMSKLTKS